MVPAHALCAAHPDVNAVEVCGRCGKFLCADCLMLVDDTSLCATCHQMRMTKASGRAIASMILGAIGVSCFLYPLGTVGWVLGVQERQAIDRGESPVAGRGLATAGIVMGAIETILMVVVALCAGLYFVFKMR